MSLRVQAERDLAVLIEDGAGGFSWPAVLTAPDGHEAPEPLMALVSDVPQLIDPDTGLAVSGRQASATFRISSLVAAGFTSLPESIPDEDSLPWVVQFNDINGNPHTFKVEQSNPDRTIGQVSVTLEVYDSAP